MKIVSLLPAATESVCALGLEACLVGVTHECDYPAPVARLPKVTTSLIPAEASSAEIDQLVSQQAQAGRPLYALNLPRLVALQPDLIVTQTLCHVCAVAESDVRQAVGRLPGETCVINLEPQTLSDVFSGLRQVARAAGIERKADEVVANLTDRVDRVVDRAGTGKRPRVALLEWLDPFFSSGHWNPELVRLAGGSEGLGQEGQPSRRVSWQEMVDWQPEVIVVACCGYDARQAAEDLTRVSLNHPWRDLPAVQSDRVWVTDGAQYFNRSGPRLVDSLEILAHVLNPEACPLPENLPAPVRSRLREC